MTITSRPDYTTLWAENGNISVPTSERIEEGYIVEKPPCELANFVENRQDELGAYYLQEGIPEWDSSTEYRENSIVKLNETVYKSLSQHINEQPDISPTFWIQAFDDFGLAAAVQEQVDDIIGTDGYLTHYVRKAAPVTTAKQIGTSYLANTGIPADNDDEAGYSFNDNRTDGFGHNGSEPNVFINGAEAVRFLETIPTNSNDRTVATTSWVKAQLLSLIYPVGAIYTTTVADNPATTFGFGLWERYAEGRTLIGYSSDVTSNTPDWLKVQGTLFGSYTVTLTNSQMPRHVHRGTLNNGGVVNDPTHAPVTASQYDLGSKIAAGNYSTVLFQDSTADLGDNFTMLPLDWAAAGGNEAHDNVQPSIVVYFWRRLG